MNGDGRFDGPGCHREGDGGTDRVRTEFLDLRSDLWRSFLLFGVENGSVCGLGFVFGMGCVCGWGFVLGLGTVSVWGSVFFLGGALVGVRYIFGVQEAVLLDLFVIPSVGEVTLDDFCISAILSGQ